MVSLEKVLIGLAVVSVALASIDILVLRGPITEEEAIAISSNSKYIKSFLARPDIRDAEVYSSYHKGAQLGGMYGVWHVSWTFYSKVPGSFIRVGQGIDEWTEAIVYERVYENWLD